MSKPALHLLALLVALLPVSVHATTGGPNGFEVWGVDSKANKLLLKESVGGESGQYRLWTFDLKAPGAAPVITSLPDAAKPPAGLDKTTSLALSEVKLSGTIAAQSLAFVVDSLLQRFDLKVEVSWSTARASAALVAYRTATVQLVDAHLLPGGRCALAMLTTQGKPEEGGYALQVPVLLCTQKPVHAPPRQAPTLQDPRKPNVP